MRIVPIPSEEGFFAREDGTIWTAWQNRRSGIPRKKWTYDESNLQQVALYPDARGLYLLAALIGHQVPVHVLVLKAFHGPCPPGMEACHEDRDHQNNAASNLRWDTHQRNLWDSNKLSQEDVEQLRQDHADGESVASLALSYGITKRAVYFIINGERRIEKPRTQQLTLF